MLASGIVHDFNNILTGILGYVSVILYDTPESSPHHERLKSITRLASTGSKLTRQILDFTRRDIEIQPTDISGLLDEIIQTYSSLIRGVKISKHCSPDLHTAMANKLMIEQVIVNLMVNACHAAKHDPALCFELQNVLLSEPCTRPFGVSQGEYIKISITDNGCGMNRETKERIYDPYFTTKHGGKGTGLGLSICQEIIRRHKGIIDVHSEKDVGTTFDVYLPSAGKKPKKHTAKPEIECFYTGNETVMIIDDEETTNSVLTEMLDSLGYKVISTTRPQEAIAFFQKYHPKISLVILDMIMPGMNGLEVLECLKRVSPEVKVLMISGYEDQGQIEKIKSGGLRFLRKPFILQYLSKAVREYIDAEP